MLKHMGSDPRPGILGRGVADPVVAEELEGLGRSWYADLRRARDVIHHSAWTAERRTPEVISELHEKGILDRDLID